MRPSPNAANEPRENVKWNAISTGDGSEQPEIRGSCHGRRTEEVSPGLDSNAGRRPKAYHGPRTEYTPNCVVSLGWLGTGRNKRR